MYLLNNRLVVNTLETKIFSDIIFLQIYDEIPDVRLLTNAMEHYLKEYNTVSKAPMPLVMFRYATEHASRVNRIIKQRGGHALLVGKQIVDKI